MNGLVYNTDNGLITMTQDGKNVKHPDEAKAADEGTMTSNGDIFATYRSTGANNIYLIPHDGSPRIKLTSSNLDSRPVATPDGSKVVFVSQRNGDADIYIMNGNGGGQTDIVPGNSFWDTMPSISADGTKVVFESLRDGNYEIYSCNSDGTNLKRLTNSAWDEEYAAFSPDGTKIVFTSFKDGAGDIYMMNADGTNQVQLTTNARTEDEPSFSIDGTKIFFWVGYGESAPGSGVWTGSIASINADGSSYKELTDHKVNRWKLGGWVY